MLQFRLPAPYAAQWAKVGDIGVSELIGEREREKQNKCFGNAFIYLFIYFIPVWFLGVFFNFVWEFSCVEGTGRDELFVGLTGVIRQCLSLFELPTTVRMLP